MDLVKSYSVFHLLHSRLHGRGVGLPWIERGMDAVGHHN